VSAPVSGGVLERPDALDLEELIAQEPPPCQVVLVMGCRCGKRCRDDVERPCGRPSVAVVEVTCPVHGTHRMWMCRRCVDSHVGEVQVPRVCGCGAPVELRVTSS
jgi:hypothetical protein